MSVVFCPINDLGAEAWRILPAMLLMGEEVVIWAPAGRHLSRCYADGLSPISPDDLIELVEKGDGKIKIAAREPYVLDPAHRSRPNMWEGQHWLEGYDDRIREMYWEDRRAGGLARVITTPPEDGYAWADEQLAAESAPAGQAAALYDSGTLPNATRERIERFSRKSSDWKRDIRHHAIREVLRDARNIADMNDYLSVNIPLTLAPYPIAEFNQIAGVKPKARREEIHSEEVLDLLHWVGSLKPVHDVGTLLAMRADPIHRDQFYRLLTARREPLVELRARISGGVTNQTFWEEALGKGCHQWISLSGWVTAALSCAMTRDWLCVAGVLAATGVLHAAGPVAVTHARREGWISDPTYSGDGWPFMLAANTTKPTSKQVKAMVDSLTKALQSEPGMLGAANR